MAQSGKRIALWFYGKCKVTILLQKNVYCKHFADFGLCVIAL